VQNNRISKYQMNSIIQNHVLIFEAACII